MSPDGDRFEALRAWVQGDLALAASVKLLATALVGRLLSGPWVRQYEAGHLWFDADVAATESGELSGGERRVLEIATSLASSEHPVDLSDAINGLDPDALEAVLAELALAGGQGR
ncbi:hypothetical protein SB749_15075 [Brevibacterium sp. SIMBA_078]|uniref:hypothetical protein n=1 Tax=Brevibacterium sp. SIMBA_078 TaxID=3085816 RepID=UPI00397C7EA2